MPSSKERVWLAEYLKCFNASEAARRADYKWPGRIGARKKEKFAEEIKNALNERSMEADEVLARLGDMARGFDPLEFIELVEIFEKDRDGNLCLLDMAIKPDFDKIKELGLGPMIKKIRQTNTGIEIEFYDAHAALVDLAKYHELFKEDKPSVEVNIIDLEEWKRQRKGRLDQIAELEAE